MYLTGHGFGKLENENRYVKSKKKQELTDYTEIFTYAMRDTLSKLVKAGKNVIFVVDVPELDFDPKNCVLSNAIYRKTRPICAIDRVKFNVRNHLYLQIVHKVLEEFPTVYAFYPSHYLCDKTYCYAEINGKFLYRNYGHLSEDGSLYIGKKFAEIIPKYMVVSQKDNKFKSG